ncbi:MAG: hypothetical protein ABI358_09895 [Ginsengibacter sp.]
MKKISCLSVLILAGIFVLMDSLHEREQNPERIITKCLFFKQILPTKNET